MRLRPQKVAHLIQRELSDLLRREVRDPRVGMVTITAVDVSPDFSNAKVLFTCLEPAHVNSISAAVDAVREELGVSIAFPDKRRRRWSSMLTDEFRSGACSGRG